MIEPDNLTIIVTAPNEALSELELSWETAVFNAEDGIEPLDSLHEAGDALVAVARMEKDGPTILGSGVMVGPGLLLTATHVLEEFVRDGNTPVFITFLPGAARAWLPRQTSTISGWSKFDENRKIYSDLSLVSCTLNSAAYADFPLMLAPMQVALPLIGERLWAVGFRHQGIGNRGARVTPFVSSGIVTAAFPNGRGDRLASPCFEVDMDTVGGMSGGAVVNSDGYLVGVVSTSFEGGPSYITLIWEAIRFGIKGTIPKLNTGQEVSLLGASALGLAKVKGNVRRDLWGDVTIVLSDEEAKLFADTVPPSQKGAIGKLGLSTAHCEEFVNKWRGDMEIISRKAAIDALENLPLAEVRTFLKVSEMPAEYLAAIHSFSVEIFEGIEDLRILTATPIDESRLSIEYFFDIQMLIWTVKIQKDLFNFNMSERLALSVNIETDGDIVRVDVFQSWYFRATLIFDQDQGLFSNLLIVSSKIKRRS